MPRAARPVPAAKVKPKRPDGRTLRARPRAAGDEPRSGPRRQAILDAGALDRSMAEIRASASSRVWVEIWKSNSSLFST